VKILILHQHFNTPQSGGAIRSYYLARALVAAGHRIVVITSFNEKKHKVNHVDGIEVHYLPIPYDNRMKFYARGWTFVRFVAGAIREAGKFPDFDYCYAISVPLTVGIIAKWLRIRYRMPYIFEVGDLWPDAPVQMGFIHNPFFRRALYGLEISIYRRAESVVALSPAIQSAIDAKVPGKKVYLIPNMADCEFFRPEEKKRSLESKFGLAGKFVVSYIGALGVANGLDYFLECANASRMAHLPIHFILCGDGAMREELHEDIQRLSLQNVTLLDFVNRDGVKEIMNVTDAVFICYKNVPVLETGSPNKFFDGLAAGKLIVINFGGWIRKEMEDENSGIFVDPSDPTDFVKRISPFCTDRNLLGTYQAAARQLAEKKYSRILLSEKFQQLFV
jgi:glycosyltransferase involved in cell wall biosynthesis